MARTWVLLALLGCGRIGFDPLGADRDGAGPDDDGPPGGGDGSMTVGDGGRADGPPIMMDPDAPLPDAQPAACAEAIPVTVGVPIMMDTCATGEDRIDGCPGASLDELVFEFVVPQNGSYTVRTYAGGTMNVITTGEVDGPCAGTAGCFGIRSTGYSAEETHYFTVEAASGTCQPIEFLISSP
jgi:hypothetical protein